MLFPGSDDSTSLKDLIVSKSKVACLIKCGGIYFVNGKFGVTWRLDQVVICDAVSRSVRQPGQCLISVSAADKARVQEDAKMKTDDDADDDDGAIALADDSDNESDAVSAELVKVIPKEEVKKEVEAMFQTSVKSVKKIIRKKKTDE